MDPDSTAREAQVRPMEVPAKKLTIQGVMTHEKLMSWVKERNPIIAQARKDEQPG